MSKKWDPFRDLVTFQEHINRLFDVSVSEHRHEDGLAGWHPQADVCESQDAIHLYVEIAGMDPDDIELKVDTGKLSLRGERARGHRRQKSYHQSEILMGPFHRSFVLPENVDPDGIEANYKQGILEIVIPKAQKPKKERVPVKVK